MQSNVCTNSEALCTLKVSLKEAICRNATWYAYIPRDTTRHIAVFLPHNVISANFNCSSLRIYRSFIHTTLDMHCIVCYPLTSILLGDAYWLFLFHIFNFPLSSKMCFSKRIWQIDVCFIFGKSENFFQMFSSVR